MSSVQSCPKFTILRRTIKAAALAALFAGVSLSAADAAVRIGWVWANDEDAGSAYAPPGNYSFNSKGGAITVTPTGLGVYNVSFAGLGSNLTDNVLTTAYDTNATCQTSSWGSGSGSPVVVIVRCFDTGGAPANAKFAMLYQAHDGNIGTASKGLAFLWADQPAAASYTPSSGYQYNSTGAANTMVRNSVGNYTATLPGLDKIGGHVQVSAYGSTPARCKTSGWFQDVVGAHVGVRCFNVGGAAADALFTLEYSRHLPTAFLTTATTTGAYAWASRPADPSYDVSGAYSYNAFGTGKLHATNSGPGFYSVNIPGSLSYTTSNMLVTAYGTSNRYCNISGWLPMNVVCYAQGGAPVNSQFDTSFQAH